MTRRKNGAPTRRAKGAPVQKETPPPSSEGVPRRGLLTPQEAADLLSVPASRMKRMRLAGEGPTYIAFGRVIRYHPQDIRVWIAANRYETR